LLQGAFPDASSLRGFENALMHFALDQGASIVAAYLMHSNAFAKSSRAVPCSLVLVAACLFLAVSARADDAKSIKGFRDAIVALGPDIDPAEAQLVSETAHHTARRLQKEWRVFPVSVVQNFLIHVGARDRGYCFEWAHDIGAELRKLPLKTLTLHWTEAHPDTRLEHNVIVVTALGQPVRSGYIIDGWRAAGRLLWWPVAKDEYPWKENLAETAWLQNRGPDPLPTLNATAQEAASPGKTSQKAAGSL
jgi:hypothetical protein